MEVPPKPLHKPLIEMRNFMSHMVARTMKLKAGNIGGLGRHVERTTDDHSNKDIDTSKSDQNYDLVERETNLQSDILNFIESEKSSTRKLRKDAVLCNEWIISSDRQFFDELSPEETRNYFEVAKDYFSENFGEKNIRYAIVHMDESTPHMHMGVVPFDSENKLSAKRMFDRKTLIRIQDELPERFKEAGFDIERGEKGSKRKHLDTDEYKAIKDLEKEKNALEVKIEPLQHKVEQLTALHEEIETEVGILQSQKNGVTREFEEVIDDIQDFKAFNDLLGHMEPKEWRAKLTSDVLLRYNQTPADIDQAERWKTYLVDGQEYIPNTFEKALNTLNKSIERLLSKIHQRFRTIKKSVGLGKKSEPHQKKNRVLNKRLDDLLAQQKPKKNEKSLRNKNKNGLER